MKMRKCLICWICLAVLCLSVLPVRSLAANNSCGENATWKFADGCLTISGTGEMDWPWLPPWDSIREQITRVVIEQGITNIYIDAFSDCTNLTSIHIPSSLTTVSSNAFGGCTALAEVYISDLESWLHLDFTHSSPLSMGAVLYLNGEPVVDLVIPETITEIHSYAFSGCQSLKSVTVHAGVETVGWGAFEDCTNLEQVTLCEGVTVLDSYAFSNCTNLSHISLPASLLRIHSHAFNNCVSLMQITLPEGLAGIGDQAFMGCTSLMRVALPSTLKSVGSNAFYGCLSLRSIPYNGTREQFDQIDIDPSNVWLLAQAYPTQGQDLSKVWDSWLSFLITMGIEAVVVLIAVWRAGKRRFRIR